MKNIKIVISEKTCSLREVLDIIGGKWAMPIIYILSKGKKRFKELERSVEGINTRMLVKELKNMEANGIIDELKEENKNLFVSNNNIINKLQIYKYKIYLLCFIISCLASICLYKSI